MAYLIRALSKISRLSVQTVRSSSSCPSIVYSEEVLQAKLEDRPVVALESTIITHGMPYPQNLDTAVEVENIIRQQGAIPATIAILKGQLTIGLTEQQIRYLSQAKGVVKVSRRDLAPVAAARLDGATTVAGTLVAADLADLPVFVTGGIGGVHREGHTTLDISADLTELGRSKTLVVCSGVKSILDIGRTLEYLETQGVCVCSFGVTDDFPAFYTVRSGFRAPHRVAQAQDAAKLLRVSRDLSLESGIVVAVPVPREHAMDEKVIEEAIRSALKEAESKGIRGKEVTPFILAAVARATGGASLAANMALIKNNAKVGADIAVEFKKLKNVHENPPTVAVGPKGGKLLKGIDTFKRGFHSSSTLHLNSENTEDYSPLFGTHKRSDNDVIVIGGANVDRMYRVSEDQIQLDGSTHACAARMCAGGVGRNMAEALCRLRGGRVRLLTAVGDDADGRYLADVAPGLILDGCVVPGARTASYAAVLDKNGECRLGLGDMSTHEHITPELVDRHTGALEKASLVVFDGNLPERTVDRLLRLCHELNKPVFFEPTDRRKAVKPLSHKRITYASPNIAELQAMAGFLEPSLETKINLGIGEILRLSKVVAQCIDFLLITLGSKGVLTVRATNNLKNNVVARLYPVEIVQPIKSVSGAGDCFASGFIHGMLSGLQEPECISAGFNSARQALLSENTVPSDLKLTGTSPAGFEQLL